MEAVSSRVEETQYTFSSIETDCSEGVFAEAVKSGGYAAGYFSLIGEFLRGKYLPQLTGVSGSFFTDLTLYLETFIKAFKGESTHYDPTFPDFEKVVNHFTLKDIPIEIRLNEMVFHFTVRVIESKEEIGGKKLRLILFSFYDHLVTTSDTLKKWDPKSIDELSGAVIEILKAIQKDGDLIDHLMMFSFGCITLNALKHLEVTDPYIPKSIVIDRGFVSSEKIATLMFPYLYPMVNFVTWLTGLDANPEKELLNFFKRMEVESPKSLEGRQVVIIEAKHDRYFSNESGFDPLFHKHLSETGVSVYRGHYFVGPGIDRISHHAIRKDWMINAEHGTSSENFFPAPPNESLSDTLASNLFQKEGLNTCFIVGGNRDSLNSMTYLQMPLLASFLKQLD
ncbi:MAG: hypothetical protein KDK76_07015 [Chlamydiia bacterium]|nr:hypothetical protein [Chlamydiia bacterium]